MSDCVYNVRWHTRCATDQKKSSKVVKFIATDSNDQTIIFYVRLLVFEIWSILYMVNFDGTHTWSVCVYCVTSCMQNRPYTKSTISQKLKVAQEKLMNQKIIFRAMRIFHWSLFCWFFLLQKNLKQIFANLIQTLSSEARVLNFFKLNGFFSNIFFFQKSWIFFQKWSNLHAIFSFWVMVIFVVKVGNFRWNFSKKSTITRK